MAEQFELFQPQLPPSMHDASHYVILRDDCAMSIRPNTPEVRDFLTLRWREMQKVRGQTTFEFKEEELYRVIEHEGTTFLQTYQGLWRSLTEHLERLGRTVSVVDFCLPFYKPNLGAAMRCLRPYQQPWIIKALLAGCSGLIGAVTRFGKTYGMLSVCEAFPDAKTIITAPGVELCEQIYNAFLELLPSRRGHQLRALYTGSKHRLQGPDITIVSVDSLGKCDIEGTELLLIDEPHAMVASGRLPKINSFIRARKYGFGATLNGRFDKKDRLIEAVIGPVLTNVSYREGVEMGAVAPLKVIFIKVPFSKDTVPGNEQRDTVYKRLLTQSSKMARLIRKITTEAIPRDWQTMLFIRDEKQADFMLKEAMDPECTIAMAKKFKPKARKQFTLDVASAKYTRVLASNIYVQGVTFPDLKVVINLAGGGANTTAIQKPGRLLQMRPGKRYGVMIDFIFECSDFNMEDRKEPPYNGIIGECWSRHKAYKEIGYDIIMTNDGEEVARIIRESYES